MDDFPLPDHLPRKATPKDVSTSLLSRMADTSRKALTADLAASWVTELDVAIQDTKNSLYERVHAELPTFNRQLETSRSLQSRLSNLSENVDKLSDDINNEKSGLLPRLLTSLHGHAELARTAENAFAVHSALACLSRCRDALERLEGLLNEGRLPHAVMATEECRSLLDGAPVALGRAVIMTEMKNRLRSLTSSVEEQLGEAYSRGLKVTSTELCISPSVQVRQSQVIVSLQDILSSTSPTSLASHLSVLRRDLLSHFIEFPLQQPISASASSSSSGVPTHALSLFPLPPHLPASPTIKLDYLRTFFNFFSSHIVPVLPPAHQTAFPRTLSKPVTQALLSFVLIPAVPSALKDVPAFLALVKDAIELEDECIVSVLGDREEQDIRTWAGNVAGHYGRKRRTELLEMGRRIVVQSGAGKETFTVEVEDEGEYDMPLAIEVPQSEKVPAVVPVQGADSVAWDFEDDESTDTLPTANTNGLRGGQSERPSKDSEGKDDAWGFGDDDDDDGQENISSGAKVPIASAEDDGMEEDSAWGWGDSDNTADAEDSLAQAPGQPSVSTNGHSTGTSYNSADDDAWDDAWLAPSEPLNKPSPHPSLPSKPIKVAKGLEKLTSKGKNHSPSSSVSAHSPYLGPDSSKSSSFASLRSPSSAFSSFTPPTPSHTHHLERERTHPDVSRPPRKTRPKETYAASKYTKELVHAIHSILTEGMECASSSVFSSSSTGLRYQSDTATPPSQLILQCAAQVLELYRAIYPVVFAGELKAQSERPMRFSSDCLYTNGCVEKMLREEFNLEQNQRTALKESSAKVKELGEWMFSDCIEKQKTQISHVLSRADGFVDTGEQERFDECESVMSNVLRNVRSTAFQWQRVLPRTKYLRAIGKVVETSLSKVLEDVLALPDIPELDSRRLSELCRILNALEGLFTDDPDAPSVVIDYVPSWLKYSYLSELLEASIADISYLFDEGALIDFEVQELANLIRALFADTPLRTNTIAKLMRGYPVHDY